MALISLPPCIGTLYFPIIFEEISPVFRITISMWFYTLDLLYLGIFCRRFRSKSRRDCSHRGEGWLGFPDLWSGQKPGWNWYLTPVVNFGEVRRSQLASPPHWGPWEFSELLRSVQMLKREWGAESKGKIPHLFIPSKIETLVPEFAVEDLSLGRTAALVLSLQWKTCPWGEQSDDDRIWKDPRGTNVEVRRMDLANWVLRTSSKFTTGVKYQFH